MDKDNSEYYRQFAEGMARHTSNNFNAENIELLLQAFETEYEKHGPHNESGCLDISKIKFNHPIYSDEEIECMLEQLEAIQGGE